MTPEANRHPERDELEESTMGIVELLICAVLPAASAAARAQVECRHQDTLERSETLVIRCTIRNTADSDLLVSGSPALFHGEYERGVWVLPVGKGGNLLLARRERHGTIDGGLRGDFARVIGSEFLGSMRRVPSGEAVEVEVRWPASPERTDLLPAGEWQMELWFGWVTIRQIEEDVQRDPRLNCRQLVEQLRDTKVATRLSVPVVAPSGDRGVASTVDDRCAERILDLLKFSGGVPDRFRVVVLE